MSGWKKLEVKDLDLDIDGPSGGEDMPEAIGRHEEYLGSDAVRHSALHQDSKNPLAIWAAYQSYRKKCLQKSAAKLPPEIFEYLDSVADRLLSAAADADARKLCQSALDITKKDVSRFNKKKTSERRSKPKKRGPKKRKK